MADQPSWPASYTKWQLFFISIRSLSSSFNWLSNSPYITASFNNNGHNIQPCIKHLMELSSKQYNTRRPITFTAIFGYALSYASRVCSQAMLCILMSKPLDSTSFILSWQQTMIRAPCGSPANRWRGVCNKVNGGGQ